MHYIAALTIILLCSNAIAQETQTMNFIEFKPSPHLHIMGNGKPLMTFDMDARTITVPDDVDVSETARQVIEAMRPMLLNITPKP